jgi:hypothetical protein
LLKTRLRKDFKRILNSSHDKTILMVLPALPQKLRIIDF